MGGKPSKGTPADRRLSANKGKPRGGRSAGGFPGGAKGGGKAK